MNGELPIEIDENDDPIDLDEAGDLVKDHDSSPEPFPVEVVEDEIVNSDDPLSNLPRLTYLEQIDKIIETVMLQERHLFTDLEISIFGIYQSLSENARELYFRLLMRNHKPHRLSSLKYESISDIEGTLKELNETIPPFVDYIVLMGLDDWFQLLKKDEMASLAKSRKITLTNMNATDLRKALMKQASHQRELCFGAQNQIRNGQDRILKEIKELIDHLMILKTGSLIRITDETRQAFLSLSIIHDRSQEYPDKPFLNSILTNLSSRRWFFPDYPVQRLDLVWPSRHDFFEYTEFMKVHSEVEKFLQDKEWSKAIRVGEDIRIKWERSVQDEKVHVSGIPWLDTFTPGWILTRIRSACVNAYFRLKMYKEESELLKSLLEQHMFCKSKRGSWYDELVKITDLYLDKREAARLCIESLGDPFVVAGRKRSIEKRARKLFKGKVRPANMHFGDESLSAAFPSTTVTAYKLSSKSTGKALYRFKDDDTYSTVEELALHYFASQGWNGIHAENSIVTTLFGLLFWDILFCPGIPGVFESPYQVAPLDLGSVYFYDARKEQIETRLKEIRNGHFLDKLKAVDERERVKETKCIGVSWRNFTRQDILEIAECIGGSALAQICGLFAKTYWIHRGGVPDLCLWKSERASALQSDSKDDIKFKLVEVKGQGDQLSEKQRVWLDCLREFGVRVETFHVKVKKSVSNATT